MYESIDCQAIIGINLELGLATFYACISVCYEIYGHILSLRMVSLEAGFAIPIADLSPDP